MADPPDQSAKSRRWKWRIVLLVVVAFIAIGFSYLTLAFYPRRSGHLHGPGRAFQIRFDRRRARIGHSLLDLESAAQNVSGIFAGENLYSGYRIRVVRLSLRAGQGSADRCFTPQHTGNRSRLSELRHLSRRFCAREPRKARAPSTLACRRTLSILRRSSVLFSPAHPINVSTLHGPR